MITSSSDPFLPSTSSNEFPTHLRASSSDTPPTNYVGYFHRAANTAGSSSEIASLEGRARRATSPCELRFVTLFLTIIYQRICNIFTTLFGQLSVPEDPTSSDESDDPHVFDVDPPISRVTYITPVSVYEPDESDEDNVYKLTNCNSLNAAYQEACLILEIGQNSDKWDIKTRNNPQFDYPVPFSYTLKNLSTGDKFLVRYDGHPDIRAYTISSRSD